MSTPRKFKHPTLPGGGPWRILPECPGLLHNTQKAAKLGPKAGRCICPRGIDMKERTHTYVKTKDELAELALLAAYREAHPKLKPSQSSSHVPTYQMNHRGGKPREELHRAACKTPRGQALVDLMFSEDNHERAVGYQSHRRLCAACPIPAKKACAKLVLENEVIPGSWGGMYAGMTPAERRKL